uniref:Uncharacterized protein n=1 Tax=uncultured bacterium A1Q1_fos_291 TaxID=1256570 RepID=L7W0N1_9BACT|nr:hypothetical protein [uncultured bacterium A1Q1_fos_291]
MKFSHWIHFCLAALITVCGPSMIAVTRGDDAKSASKAAEEKSADAETREVKKAAETVVVRIGDLNLKLPKTWKQSDATLPMRLATFEVPAGNGDTEKGEFVVSSFPGGGGGVDANIGRWIGQFSAEGREAVVRQGKADRNEYFIVNISGTYLKPTGPPILRKTKETPGQRMVGVILNLEDKAVYFLKLTGPDATVAAQLDAVRASFGGNPDDEKEYEF